MPCATNPPRRIWFHRGMLLYALAGLAIHRMAAFEDRSPWPWTIGSLVLAIGLAELHVLLELFGPGVALVVAFVGLWIARSRDMRDRDQRIG